MPPPVGGVISSYFFVSQITSRVFCPNITIHCLCPDPVVAAAYIKKSALAASVHNRFFFIFQPSHNRIFFIYPYLAERPLFYISKRIVAPELVCVHIAEVVNAAYGDTGAVSAPHLQKLINPFCFIGVFLFNLHIKIDSIRIIITRKYIFLNPLIVKFPCFITDKIQGHSCLLMAQIILGYFSASS